MKSYFLIVLALLISDPKEIAKINSLKKEAEAAFLNGDYYLAIEKYSYLTDSMGLEEDQIRLNLAHAYYHSGDTSSAKMGYGKLGSSTNKALKSIAYQQLGVMSKDAKKLEQALQQLKSAIKANPRNEEAIYNYEVVKKLLEEQKQQQQQQDQQNKDQNEENKNEENQNDEQNQDQKKDGEQNEEEKKDGENQEQDQEKKDQDQQNQDKKEGEQEEQEQEKSQEQMTKEKLEEMGISEEKARQLLEAMRQSEIKYLQNQKRKATKRPPSGKPDW